MRVPGYVVLLCIVVLGAAVLAPVIAQFGIAPLPGDMTLNFQGHRVFLPFTQSLIASVVLALLFSFARK